MDGNTCTYEVVTGIFVSRCNNNFSCMDQFIAPSHSLPLISQGSGSDEIVACAWDGMTYIVDQKRNIVRYKFEQNVSAFTAGNPP